MLVNLKAIARQVTALELLNLSSDNPGVKFETTKEGKLIVTFPRGNNSSRKNLSLTAQVCLWNNQKGLGEVFGSSTGFTLSNGAIKSPSVSWIKNARWNKLTRPQQDTFAPIDPDFVPTGHQMIELRSPTDRLDGLQAKMKEYMSCGVRLGWLIDPAVKQVEIYCQGQSTKVLDNLYVLFGENVLPQLNVELTKIFND